MCMQVINLLKQPIVDRFVSVQVVEVQDAVSSLEQV